MPAPLPRPARGTWIPRLVGLTLAVVSPTQATSGEPSPEPPSITVTTAHVVGDRSGRPLGFLDGTVLAEGDPIRLNVVFVIDASAGTAQSSGADIDGDGAVARASGFLRRRVGPDSILAAEVAAVEAVLDQLEGEATQVGVVAYAGSNAGTADNAWVVAQLTASHDRVRTQLRELLANTSPEGSSDLPAGLRLARLELIGAQRRARDDARRRIVLLSEGYPESPRESAVRTEQRALTLARRLRSENIRVHTYAVGPDALSRPRAAIEVAEQSRGRYVAVENPGDLPRVLRDIDLGTIETVRITHVASGEPALAQILGPDGRYSALVALGPGDNEVEVYARNTDGTERAIRVPLRPRGRLAPRQQLTLRQLELELDDDVRRGVRIQTDDEGGPPPTTRPPDETGDDTRRGVTVETDPEPPKRR